MVNPIVQENISLTPYVYPGLTIGQRIFVTIGILGLLTGITASINTNTHTTVALFSSLLLISVGVLGYGWQSYVNRSEEINNNLVWVRSLTNRGLWAWGMALSITGFYILLYFFPQLLGLSANGNTGLVGLFDPLSYWIKNKPATQWFMYGVLYTMALLLFGIKFLWKYRKNKYQRLRTLSVMFFQLCFAFTIPEILERLNQPSMDLKNMWPLNYYFFFDWNLDKLIHGGTLGIFLLGWGILMILVISPILTYFYGKRWYCSWVCGCGGLAETAGDPFRHLSDKTLRSWKIERWLVHSILVFIILVTCLAIYSYFSGRNQILFFNTYKLREWYGFFIGGIFSGVIGVGFYPILGSRVWCRFGCPMAAILGIQQKFFSRFRITTNGGQCISCGNCSTYCEMGIDVRHYAQRGQNIVRASCVGCGICATVCPRGVLKLENGSMDIHERTSQLKVLKVDSRGVRF
jgi:Pyruvate/2-oxoacid:ferredoxin oxidoreductase delta subunit